MKHSPFKFLDSYTKDDRNIFFGRNREIEELYQRVFESKLLLVYGVSGTGKSSLIHCGLANKFQETDWLPLVIRRGGNMIESMAAVIRAASITAQKGQVETPAHFKKAVRSLYLDHYKPVFFIFDQFEELFIFGDREERKAFIAIVKALIESDLQCRLIFVMREEYMAGVTEFERDIPAFFANRVRIEKMSHTNALETIKEPCKIFNISLEEGFAENLLEKLSPESADVELTYLQVFLDKIFRLARGEKGAEDDQSKLSFTSSLLQKTGNVSDLLGSFLDEQISLLSDPVGALAVLKSFVSVKGTKQQMSLNEVKEYTETLGKPIEDSVLLEMLQTFIHLRILRDKDQDGRYELRHDALATKIYEKITLVEKEILEIRQFVENAFNNWQKRKVLISADDLDYVAPYESRLHLSKEINDLVERSKDELIKAKKRRRNVLTAAAMMAFLVLASFTLWAVIERNKSDRNFTIAKSNYLSFVAEKATETDPTKALRIAEYAMSLDSSENVRKMMYQIYRENAFYKIVATLPGSGTSICLSPDGKTILVGSSDSRAYLIDLDGNLKQTFTGHNGWITSVAFSPDGNTILTGSRDGTAILWNTNGEKIQVYKGNTEWINSVVFSPDGKKILTGSNDRTARLWDKKGNMLQLFNGTFYCRSVAFSPDGNTILAPNYETKIMTLWNLQGKILTNFKGHNAGLYDGQFSPDGNYIITGSTDMTAILYDISGEIRQVLKGHEGKINQVSFSPDGETILTVSDIDNTVRLWNMQGKVNQVLNCQESGVSSAVFSPDGKGIYSVSSDKTVRFWDFQPNPQRLFKAPGESTVYNSIFSADGKTILMVQDVEGNLNIHAFLWDLQGNLIHEFIDPEDKRIRAAAISPDGHSILTLSSNKTARLWDRNGNDLQKYLNVDRIDFLSDSVISILSMVDRSLSFYNLKGNLVNKFKGSFTNSNCHSLSPHCNNILIGYWGKVPRLYDMNNNLLKEFKGHEGAITSVAFSPDGKTVLTGSVDKSAIIWDLNGSVLKVYKANTLGQLTKLSFSPDGKKILTCSIDGTIRLWDLNGNLIQTFKDEWPINSSYFTKDSKSIITISSHGSVYSVDIKPPLAEFQKSGNYEKLSVSQKIETGIWTFNDAYNSKDPDQIFEAGNWYFKNFDILSPDKGIEYLDNTLKLYSKAFLLKNNSLILIEWHKACIQKMTLFRDRNEGGEKTMREIKRIYQRLQDMKDIRDLLIAASYFGSLSASTDSMTNNLNDKYIFGLMDKIINHPGLLETNKNDFHSLTTLSLAMLRKMQFKTSLKGFQICWAADSTYVGNIAWLPMAYLLNNQYDNANRIIEKWKNEPLTGYTGMNTYGDVFLTAINILEVRGVKHPDFEKAKELLKK